MTSLVGGVRVPKTHPRLEAYGTVDELNAFIGLLITYVADEADREFLFAVQHKLFSVGSYLATDQEHKELRPQSIIHPEDVERPSSVPSMPSTRVCLPCGCSSSPEERKEQPCAMCAAPCAAVRSAASWNSVRRAWRWTTIWWPTSTVCPIIYSSCHAN